ncbi:GTPase [Aquimarina gracilis]|uniref:GTPase n=1 Tax=Aquimarina gracilis TaxID=874422 RepID=A0ABU5ZRD8_9FLAO|nr:GTPase [Aquimarina gracilis]MEB3343927.1 GTPase [Aquimarina gracilis]
MKKLVFVYNATSDFVSKSLDLAHKIIRPSTYSCDLCSLTHGNFSEKKVWKDFRENIKAELVFMYKDEFLKSYPDVKGYDFPVIFQEKDYELDLVLDSKEMAGIQSIKELIASLKKKSGLGVF